MAAPLKISTLVTIDATQAKAGGAEAQRAIEGMGQSADMASTKIQQLIARSAGIGGGAANQNIREWNGALAMQGRAVDELRAKYNPLFAVINQYKASLTEIRTLHAQGILSTDEMTSAISRQRQATLSSIDAIKGRNTALSGGASAGGAAFRRVNLGYQLNDIAQGAALGAPVSMIAAQQLPQIAQLYAGQGGMKAALADIGAIATGVIGTVGALPLALGVAGAAAIAYASLSGDAVRDVDDVLSEHQRNIKALAESYGIAERGARAYSAADRAVAEAAARNSLAENTKRQVESAKELREQFSTFVTPGRSGGGFFNLTADFKPFQSAFNELDQGIRTGTVNADAFVQKVKDIAEANPGARKFADEILRAADGLVKLNGEASKAQDLFAQLATSGPILDPLGAFNLDRAQTERADRTRSQYLQEQIRYEAELRQATARTLAERIAAARAAAGAEYNPDESAAERTKRIDRAGELVRISGEADIANARRERQRSLDETIAGQRLELSLIGQTTSAIEAQRMEARLLAEAKAEALRNGTTVSEEEIQRIREAAAEYGRLASAIEATRALRGQRQEIDQLQLEISLVGRLEADRRRTLALAEAEKKIREQGLSGDYAEQFRRGAVEAETYRMKLEQVQDAWGAIQSAGENAIDSFVEGLASGDIEGALDSIAKDITKTVLQLGVANPLKNALFGTNYGTLSDVGGIFANLFGGGAAGVSGSNVGSMTVTAASVIVNGGIGGIGGSGLIGQVLSGLGANQNMPSSMSSYAAAIRQIESSGNYQALGPLTKSGDRAYGAYQVMGANIPAWTKGALGQVLSPQQFLTSPSAQDAVFAKYFGQSLSKFGNANDAASVWFTGRPLAQGGNAADILGTTGKAYVDKFNAALGQVTNTAGAANQNLGTFGNNLGGLGSALQNAASGIGSGGSGGGLFGALAGLFGFGGGSQWAAAASGSIIGLFDKGGYTGDGGRYEPAGITHKGEVVWNQDDVARAGGWQTVEAMRLGRRGYATGGAVARGPAANTNSAGDRSGSIVINNYSSARVETEEKTDDRGARQTVFTLSDAVGDAMARKGGGANKALSNQFGVRRQGRRR